MDNNKKQIRINYAIVAVLFIFVIGLWFYLGNWEKSFKFYGANKPEKSFSMAEVGNLWANSKEKFSKIAPQANYGLFKEGGLTNKIVDQALNKSVVFENTVVRYPDLWQVDLASSTTSTLNFLSADKEMFFVKTMTVATSSSIINSWHEQVREDVLGWSWQEVGEGLVGFKINNDQARIVGLFQVSTSTVFVLERESNSLQKVKDGQLEVLLYGLRK